MEFVCPQCHGPLAQSPGNYHCTSCPREFPIVCGIPDFRLFPDPYIDIVPDREKAQHLNAATAGMTFEQAVRYYYSITPDDPPDLAAIWTARALAEVDISRALLHNIPANGQLLDVGCSTGALLIAAGGGVGVDVALRWLVIGSLRIRESGVQATLVCANAEHLPFPPDSFDTVTCIDTLEHLSNASSALTNFRRVAKHLLLTSNNRWCLLSEPHVHLWGVGLLPRSRQKRYVACRRGDLHPYRITLRGPAEGRNLVRAAGWSNASVGAAPLHAPHRAGMLQALLSFYRICRKLPGLVWLAPRWLVKATR